MFDLREVELGESLVTLGIANDPGSVLILTSPNFKSLLGARTSQ